MPKDIKEGNNNGKKNGSKSLKKHRLKRLFLILTIICLILAAVATYAAFQYFMKDLPEFNLDLLKPAKTSFLYDKDGTLVTPLMGAENRIVLPLGEISQDLIDAFIAIEDDRFFEHPGFDARGIFRAAWNNITNKSGNTQGGSTITQQLVKNTFLTPDRSIKRKVQEVYMAYQLEQIFSKEEILEFYLNRIFFGFNAYGVEAAANTYFGKSAKEVTLAEAAMLAGIPNLPARYSPFRNFDEAKQRQKIILARMVDVGMISQEEADAASAEEIMLADRPTRMYPHSWFVDNAVLYDVPKILATLPEYKDLSTGEIEAKMYTSGLHIYTTLDQRIQQAVVEIIDNPHNYRRFRDETQAAVVIVEPKTGYVSAIVGGRNYHTEHNVFNRAVDGKFQAGSVLKPIIAYAPAFNEGIASPATILDDAPGIFPGLMPYLPNNFDMNFKGLMTARYALATSRNLPAIRLLQELGVEKGKTYAERMGITGFSDADDTGLSMVVGGLAKGVNPWQVAQAYATLANEGVRTDFTTITKIVDNNGKVIYEHMPNREEVLSPEAAWLTTDVLIDTVLSGTATYLKIGRTVAAKTGTSDKKRDAWMAAYTPDYVAVFWIGEDLWPENVEGRYESFLIGGFMNPILKAVHEGLPKSEFKRPTSLRQASICKKSGLLPGEFCPEADIISDWFLSNNIPSEVCTTHVKIEICKDSGLLAGEFCPVESRETKVFFNRPEFIVTDKRWLGEVGRKPADAKGMPPTKPCDKHTSRPDDITSLKVAQDNKTGDVTLTWKAAAGATGYIIARKWSGNGDYIVITPNPITALTYIDKGLKPGIYSYTLQAINAESVKSRVISASITVEPPPPTPPDSDDPEPNPPVQEED